MVGIAQVSGWRWLAVAGGVLVVHLALALTLAGQGWVTPAGVGAMCLVAAALCGAEARRDHPGARGRWALPAAAFLLWAAGSAASAWPHAVVPAAAARARIDTLLFALRGVPWLLLLARTGDGAGQARLRRIDTAQVLLFAGVSATLLFPRLAAGALAPVSASRAISHNDVQNLALALLAVVSSRVQPGGADRRFLAAPAWLLASYALEALVVNHVIIARLAPPPGSPLFLLGSAPLLLFIAVVLRGRGAPPPAVARGSGGAAAAARLLMPAAIGLATLAMAFVIARSAFAIGLAAGLAVLILYAARAALTQAGFARAERTLIAARDRMEQLAQIDFLTGLPNRRRFDAAIRAEWRRATRANAPLTVLLIDVDEFKRFNDRAGHVAGDDCLRDVALAMQAQVRREGDLLARFGGEEFVMVAPFTDMAGGLALAELLRAAVHALDMAHPASAHGTVTVSIGVATAAPRRDVAGGGEAGGGAAAIAALLAGADEALYRAKSGGRNRVASAAACTG